MPKIVFDLATAIFASVSAVFWYLSASAEIPQLTTSWGAMPSDAPFFVALRTAASMNEWGALFAALAASSATASAILSAAMAPSALTVANPKLWRTLAQTPLLHRFVPDHLAWSSNSVRDQVRSRIDRECEGWRQSKDAAQKWRSVARVALADDFLNADAWLLLGECEYDLSRWEASRQAYSWAVTLRREARAFIGLADACAACRLPSETVSALRSALAVEPKSVDAYARLGQEYEGDDDRTAAEMYERAISLQDDGTDKADTLVRLALTKLRLSDAKAGRKALVMAAQIGGGDALSDLFCEIAEAIAPFEHEANMLLNEIKAHDPKLHDDLALQISEIRAEGLSHDS